MPRHWLRFCRHDRINFAMKIYVASKSRLHSFWAALKAAGINIVASLDLVGAQHRWHRADAGQRLGILRSG
jgi:hypothetical protein